MKSNVSTYTTLLFCFAHASLMAQTETISLSNTVGEVAYESKDHRSNVYEVVSDRKTISNNQFQGIIIAATDYYPYGSEIPTRSLSEAEAYKYGFQGQEKDKEVKGNGNSINYKYRIHDPRLGRFFAVDPLGTKYPYYSSYQFSGNRLIDAIEIEGLEAAVINYVQFDSEGNIIDSFTYDSFVNNDDDTVTFSRGLIYRHNYPSGSVVNIISKPGQENIVTIIKENDIIANSVETDETILKAQKEQEERDQWYRKNSGIWGWVGIIHDEKSYNAFTNGEQWMLDKIHVYFRDYFPASKGALSVGQAIQGTDLEGNELSIEERRKLFFSGLKDLVTAGKPGSLGGSIEDYSIDEILNASDLSEESKELLKKGYEEINNYRDKVKKNKQKETKRKNKKLMKEQGIEVED